MRIILALCVYLSLMKASAQQLFFQQYSADVYKGATQNWEVDQDEEGVLYFANNDGVLTFDGLEWNLLPMPNKEFVFSVALDSRRNIFVSSYNELGFFERLSGNGYRYHSFRAQLPEKHRDFKYMDQIVVFNDTVFFVHHENIFIVVNDEVRTVPEKNARLLKLGNKLFLIKKDGLFEYHNFSFLPSEAGDDVKGRVIRWIGVYDHESFLVLDDESNLWKLMPEANQNNRLTLLSKELEPYLRGLARFRMIALDNGMIGILSRDEVLFLDQNARPVYSLPKEAAGENFTNRLLFEDRQHNLWVTTNASLLQITTSSPLSYYDKHNGLNGVILALGKSGDHQYAGTTSGVFYKEGKDRFSLLPECVGETWNFYPYQNKLLVAHSTGVFIVDGKKAKRLIDHQYVHSLCPLTAAPGKILMGTYNTGMWLLESSRGKWMKTKVHGFEEEIRFMEEDADGSLWISHYNKGVYRLRLNDRFDSVTSVRFYETKDGLPSHLNNRLIRKRDSIAVMTTRGIYQYNAATDSFSPAGGFNHSGNEAYCIYAMDEDTSGDIYFWGGYPQKEYAGVLKKTGDRYTPFFTPFKKTAVDIRDQRVDVDAPVLCVSDREVWIGNNLKLIRYNPLQKTFYSDPFRTLIKNVWARDSAIHTDTERLSYSMNNIRVLFVSTFMENPERTEYQYKLDGFRSEWSAWSHNNEAVFTNLSNGRYTFYVRSRNLYGQVSAPITWTFYIDPPWYKTWWAYIAYGVLAISFVALMVEVNTRRIRRSKKILEKKVRKKTKKLRARNKEVLEKGNKIVKQARELEALNLTKDKLFSIVSHDLRAPVKQIHVIMSMMEKSHLTESEFREYFPKLKESVEHTVNLTDNLLYWANSQMDGIKVKPSVINLKEIAEENYWLFKPLADGKSIRFDNLLSADTFVYADRDMVKLVLRNLVNNAIKFTEEGKSISVGSSNQNGAVEVFVEDTGIGLSSKELESLFNKNNLARKGTFGEKGIGLGLLLCHEFIKKNGGTIHVSSEPGKGSRFSFTLPAHA